MPKYKVKVKLVKVIPGYIEIEADDLEDAFIIAEEYASVEQMTCIEDEFYEDLIIDKKNSRRIK